MYAAGIIFEYYRCVYIIIVCFGNQNAVAVVLETKSEKEDISKDKWKQELVKPA